MKKICTKDGAVASRLFLHSYRSRTRHPRAAFRTNARRSVSSFACVASTPNIYPQSQWRQPRIQTLFKRGYATNESGQNIAVVGGGLTGLTTAYYLAKELPASATVTVYESSDRLGGWIRTDKIPVDVGGVKGTVNFERGPRTLTSLNGNTWRYDDLVLYDLALDLGLDVHSPPDGSRYIYYPDHLVTMPPNTNFLQLLREPLFLNSFWAGLGFLWRRMRRQPVPQEDLSIAQWLKEISGSVTMGENLGSAMIHGIYGGDIDRLSARSVLDRAYWAYYMPNNGPLIRHMPEREEQFMTDMARDPEVVRMAKKKRHSLLHFGSAGLEALPKALADALNSQSNVTVKLGESVDDITYKPDTKAVEVRSNKGETKTYDRVISTTPSSNLVDATGDSLSILAELESVSIMTVNLWYPVENIKPPGFGYLIPRSVAQENNPERALGVFFDSDVVTTRSADEPAGTKLFVLMGGHYYDKNDKDAVKVPSEEEAIEQAKAVVERHLGIPRDAPCHAVSRLAKDCIPQHFVGHRDLMASADKQLQASFGGKLSVAGGSYSKIGAMGAIRLGHDIAKQVVKGEDVTGLEEFRQFPPQFLGLPIQRIPVRRFRQLENVRANTKR